MTQYSISVIAAPVLRRLPAWGAPELLALSELRGAGDGGLSREQWGDTEPSEAWLDEVEVGWSHVFMLAVAVDCAGMLLYGALLSGERQPWAPRSARAQHRGGAADE